MNSLALIVGGFRTAKRGTDRHAPTLSRGSGQLPTLKPQRAAREKAATKERTTSPVSLTIAVSVSATMPPK